MAAEFECSDCHGDGTRCECHKRRGPRLEPPSVEQRIAENERTLLFLTLRCLELEK